MCECVRACVRVCVSELVSECVYVSVCVRVLNVLICAAQAVTNLPVVRLLLCQQQLIRVRHAFMHASHTPIRAPFYLSIYPDVFVVGLASAVYQFGILDWTTAKPFTKDGSGGISWLLPCSTAFLLIGLALDYDIFLFSRV